MALLAPAMLFAGVSAAIAQDATRVGGTAGNDYSTGANWTPATTPTGTATFATTANTNIPISLLATVGAWNFTGASAYNFTINSGGGITFTGTGINVTGGSASITNNWELQFTNSSSAGSASITNNATTAFLNSSSAGTANIINNGTIQFSQTSTAGGATITTNNGASVRFFDTSTGGNARFITNTGGNFDISALSSAGMTAGSIQGGGNYLLGSKTLTVGSNNLSTVVAGVISDGGARRYRRCAHQGRHRHADAHRHQHLYGGKHHQRRHAGSGRLDRQFVGRDGQFRRPCLTGIGTAGSTTIMSGGTLAPGNAANPTGTLNISGNLAFQSGALYVVQVTPIAASSTNVSGTATLTGGTVNAQFAAGSYMSRQYIIVTAAGGLGGTTFANLTNTHLPAGFTDSLSYNGNKVYLNLTAVLGGGSDPSYAQRASPKRRHQPQQFLQRRRRFAGELRQRLRLDRRRADHRAEPTERRSRDRRRTQFIPAHQRVSEPDARSVRQWPRLCRRRGFGGPSSAMAAAHPASRRARRPIRRSSDSRPPAAKDCGLRGVYEPRWSAWGSAFGDSGSANGNTSAGSNNITASTFGFAGGMDYHVTPNTLFGFALAGAGTNWGLANSLGTGRGDAFEAGTYGINWFGPAYVAGALSFTNNWFTTSRSALGDQLNANFSGKPTARAPKAAIASPCCRRSG